MINEVFKLKLGLLNATSIFTLKLLSSLQTFPIFLISNRLTVFDILKLGLAVRLRGHKQRELNGMFIPFFYCSPLDLTIELNFYIYIESDQLGMFIPFFYCSPSRPHHWTEFIDISKVTNWV